VLDLGIVAEIDRQPELLPGRLQVVDQLCTMLINQLLDRLDLDDDLPEALEVRLLLLLQPQARLEDRPQKSVALFLVHLEAGTDDPVALLFEDNPFLSHFRAFRVFRSCFPRANSQGF
jgi:hypothetical protein